VDTANEGLPIEQNPLSPAYFPTPDNPPWNSIVAGGVWFASVLMIILVPTVVVLPYLISEGQEFSKNEALGEFLQRDATAIILQIVAVIPAHVFTLAIAWVVVTKLGTFSFRETLGWRSGGMVWWHYVALLLTFFAIAAVVGSYFPEQENELTRVLRSSRSAVFLVAFMATFTAPLVEEVVYRGILYSAFRRTIGTGGSVATVTFLFALVHVPQYYPSYSTIFLLLLLSLVLTLVRVKSGNLLPCIILHTIFNAIQSVVLILEPYMKPVETLIEPAATAFIK
jgi:membrane protease YdiL (CAAX protease family)